MKTTFRKFLSEASNKNILVVNFKIEEVQEAFKKKFPSVKFVEFGNDISLDDVDYVVIGTTFKFPDEASALIKRIKKAKIPFFCYGSTNPSNFKDSQYKFLKKHDVKQIPSIFANPKDIDVGDVAVKFGFPIVAKVIDGSKGRGVKLVKSEAALKTFLEKCKESVITIQKFIPNDGDWRLFYVKDDLVFSILRKSSDEKEFRNNTSLGGEATEKKPPKEISDLADKAVKALNIDVAGVDIVQDKNTGEVYVMEVNEAPQFFSDPGRFKKAIDRIFKEINKSL